MCSLFFLKIQFASNHISEPEQIILVSNHVCPQRQLYRTKVFADACIIAALVAVGVAPP
jgi:hypothetical protein